MEFSPGQINGVMLETIWMIRNTAGANFTGLMDGLTKASGKMESRMDAVRLLLLMGLSSMVSGRMERDSAG